MFIRLLRRLHRDRRRIAVALILLFAAGVIEMWNKTDLLPLGVLEVAVGLGMVIFFGSFLIGSGLALPSLRHAYAPIGFTMFGAAVLGRIFPGSAFSLMTITEGGGRTLAGLITTGLFVHFLFYGRWSDGLFKKHRAKVTTRLTTKLEVDQVWHGFVPTPGRREALHDKDVLSVDWVDRERTKIRIIRWAPPLEKIEEFMQVDEYLPGAYIVYRYVRPSSKPGKLIKGLRAVKVIDLVDKRVVYVTEFRHDIPLRKVLFNWLDDALGREEDKRLQLLEAQIHAIKTKGTTRAEVLEVGGVLQAQRKRPRSGNVARLPNRPRGDQGPLLAAGE